LTQVVSWSVHWKNWTFYILTLMFCMYLYQN